MSDEASAVKPYKLRNLDPGGFAHQKKYAVIDRETGEQVGRVHLYIGWWCANSSSDLRNRFESRAAAADAAWAQRTAADASGATT